MPAVKRARTMSSTLARKSKRKARASKRSLFRTNQTQRNWPYASWGTGQLFDPFPAKMRARLRYSTTVTLTCLPGVPTPYLFRANGIYDPDYSGTGHQPYGHDTYQSIYNHYMVRSATIVVRPTSQGQGIYGVTVTDDTSVNGGYQNVREVKTTKFAVLTTANTSDNCVVNYYNRNQIYPDEQDGCTAQFGADPARLSYFHMWVEPNNATSGGSSDYRFVVDITYDVDMWNLKDLGLS